MRRLDPVEDLLRAFAARDLDAIRTLADAGLDLDAVGGGGLTTLMRAVLRGDSVAVEWILAAGADPDARTTDGKAALDFARELNRGETSEGKGQNDLVELLIVAGATSAAPAGSDTSEINVSPAERRPALPAPRRRVPREEQPVPFLDRVVDAFADEIDDRFNDQIG